jgi:phosphoglycerate dehydrogenase-like enzyme
MTGRTKALFCTMHAKDRLLRMTREYDDIDWMVAGSPSDVQAKLPNAEILILNNRICTPDLGAALRSARRDKLKWIHFVTAGIEMGLTMGLPAGVAVTTSAGTNGPVLAEHAVTLLLASMRRFSDMFRGQQAHEWRRLDISSRMATLEEATVCVIGLGAVGRDVARKLRAFDADVIAVSRGGGDPNVSRVYPRAEMDEALARSDAVVVCANSDASTFRMIGAREFAALKPGAFVVNMSRGEIIDEAAMIDALRGGRLAGAGLDVTDPEPPARDNPLWDLPGVIISPHVSGGGSGEKAYRRQAGLFAENWRRYQLGEPLLQQVTLEPGSTF